MYAEALADSLDLMLVLQECFNMHFTAAFSALQRSSGAGEPPPDALTEPYVNLSAHTALVIQPLDEHIPSEQTT